ncbi:DUF4231 domain-containing protein [Amycolatopsis sp. NPDC049868]|uniref:DUF4231 domain-containing protein n=1 Tax=Amycolatopsis sp. NPDC049868 TaxID=3363934 RepID=UPI0037B61CB1
MAAEYFSGEKFTSWLKGVVKAPTYRVIGDDEPSRNVRRVIIRSENRLRTWRTGRAVSAWLTLLFAVLLTALVVFHVWRQFIETGWLYYSILGLAIALTLSAAILTLMFVWNCSVGRVDLATMRELYNERVADELDDAVDDDDDHKLLKVRHQYRESAATVIEDYRQQASRYKRRHDRFQTITIIGSVATSAITTASVSFSIFRVLAIVISLVVGIATGINGYYKFRERSFNLQQASDLVEREYNSVQLRVGRYAHCSDEADAYRLFCQQVEMIRDEQSKRQQQLEQPVETKKE